MANDSLSIAVVYALPHRQAVVRINVPVGTTALIAIERSGLLERYPELRSSELNCAIYGRQVPLTQVLGQSDRIEILRPLLIDPKESRRQTAAKNKLKAR